jgi:hypothetical protein
MAGSIGPHGAELLAEEIAARGTPRAVDSGSAALSQAARHVLPLPDPAARRAAHDMRNALATVRLRLQMAAGLPPELVQSAIRSIDEAAASLGRST